MNKAQNLNNNSNSNFEEAYKLSEKIFSHDELSNMLCCGSLEERQIASLKFDYVKSPEDAALLVNNLTGCDGKIRDAVAYKINYFLNSLPETRKFFAKNSAKTFAAATIDINANICRLVVNSAKLLKVYKDFSQVYTHEILNYTEEAMKELDKFIFRDKKYVINKQIFKLYWCLEALSYFYEYVDKDLLYKILQKCADAKEYTIREKCAKIVLLADKFTDLKTQLMNDENYYVREIFTSSRHFEERQDAR